jgi:elongator complex protein 4
MVLKGNASNTTEKSNDPPPYCSLFDLTKRVPESILEDASLSLIDPSLETDDDSMDQYDDLLQKIRKIIVDGNFR